MTQTKNLRPMFIFDENINQIEFLEMPVKTWEKIVEFDSRIRHIANAFQNDLDDPDRANNVNLPSNVFGLWNNFKELPRLEKYSTITPAQAEDAHVMFKCLAGLKFVRELKYRKTFQELIEYFEIIINLFRTTGKITLTTRFPLKPEIACIQPQDYHAWRPKAAIATLLGRSASIGRYSHPDIKAGNPRSYKILQHYDVLCDDIAGRNLMDIEDIHQMISLINETIGVCNAGVRDYGIPFNSSLLRQLRVYLHKVEEMLREADNIIETGAIVAEPVRRLKLNVYAGAASLLSPPPDLSDL